MTGHQQSARSVPRACCRVITHQAAHAHEVLKQLGWEPRSRLMGCTADIGGRRGQGEGQTDGSAVHNKDNEDRISIARPGSRRFNYRWSS